MKDGFVKVAAVTPEIKVADVDFNVDQICKLINEAEEAGAKIIAFPELCVTGYTCGDLFTEDLLIKESKNGLLKIAESSAKADAIIFVGVPLKVKGKLYNTVAAINKGKVIAFTTKTFLPNYAEFYEMRQFTAGPDFVSYIEFEGDIVPFGPQILFDTPVMENLVISAEICEDLWSPVPPSIQAAREGATIIVNASASDETVGKARYRRALVTGQSARLISGYIYANAGEGESSTDLVFAGRSIIAENGTLLQEAKPYDTGILLTEIDVDRLAGERQKNTTFAASDSELVRVTFEINVSETSLTRNIRSLPFVPDDDQEMEHICEEILSIQAAGLKKRLVASGSKKAVIGISGGLDSTLALLVTVRAFESLGRERKNIVAVTMPCFGTTDRTYNNACVMAEKLGVTLKEVKIADSVRQHFADIGHDENVRDVTYENAQARERTQVLMDLANELSGIVVGTGDLSELALGWATYNGDHMSMYGVNASVPKTLVRHLVKYYAKTEKETELKNVLFDVLDTPVSPELLPAENGEIAQKTEELVGPYELHDFFLYYFMRFGFAPSKILRLAEYSFKDAFSSDCIRKWLEVFIKRFFSQQFKRSCLPDGPKVGTVALSPRGDWRMPSDASSAIWLKDITKN